MSDNSEWASSIENATLELIQQMVKKMDKSCLLVEASAKAKCPVDMGILRVSITSETEVSMDAVTGRIGSNMEYAPYVHQGTGIYAEDGNGRKTPWKYHTKAGKYKGWHFTKGQKPQPFLKDAVAENRSQIQKILGG